MQSVAKPMKEYLSKIITKPKERSSKWVSSSVPKDKLNTDLGKFCSPDYHVNNALSPVLFYEALQQIPNHSVLIEISPHCLLQAILRRCVSSTCTNLGLLKARHENNMEFFMQNLGKIYETGLPINLARLYPAASYPIPRGTPMISPIMKWDHSQDWYVITMKDMQMSGGGNKASSNTVVVDCLAKDSEDKFMLDHIIDGRILYPFAGHVVLAWKTLCKLRGLDFQTTPVVIEDMNVYRATLISVQPVQLDIVVSTATGSFEIMENDQVAAAGKITIPESPMKTKSSSTGFPLDNEKVTLTGSEVYKELRLRGYEYGPTFRPIVKASEDGTRTEISWTNNWVTFIDAMLQAILLSERGETLKLPVRIRYLAIDPEKHLQSVETDKSGTNIIRTVTNPATNQCVAGGIVLRDLTAQSVARRTTTNGKLIIETVNFVKHQDDSCFAEYPEFRKETIEYQKLCQAMIQNITKKIVEAGLTSKLPNASALADVANSSTLTVDADALKRFVEKRDFHLVKVLQKISETNFSDKQSLKDLTKILEDGFKVLDQDKLWRLGYHERMVKPLLDIIMENSTGHRLKGCAIEPTSFMPAKLCKDIQGTQPLLETEWTLLGTKVDELDETQTRQADLNVLKVDLENPEKGMDKQLTGTFDIVLLDKLLHKKTDIQQYLEKVKQLLRDDGFVLVCEVTDCFEIPLALLALQGELPVAQKNGARKYGVFYDHENWLKMFEKSGFSVVAHQGHGLMNTMYLLRKLTEGDKKDNKIMINADDIKDFSWLQPLQTATESDELKKMWLTNEKAVENGTVGLGLCLKSELSKNVVRTIVNGSLKNETSNLKINEADLKKVFTNDLHSNVYRDGVWGSFRHIPLKEDQMLSYVETEHAFMNTLVPGDLNSLNWVESSNVFWKSSTNDSNKKLCNVYFAALNFRDIMLATGRLSGDAIPGEFTDRDCLLGMEYSGRWSDNGERVMGLSPAQALATTVVADKRFTWAIPNNWTMEQAATVPVAYTTAYYSLVVRGRVKPGDKVLIHGGSGGVGQAAIAVALSCGCEVFTTTSSEEKKKYLQSRFPQLKDRHFSSSRTTDFEQTIMEETDGRGVDVVLNSLSEDKLQASVRCLAQHGRFLEIGKFDLSNNTNLGMAIFLKNVTFHGILLDALFGENNTDWLDIRKMFEDGINSGVVQPLDTTVFSTDKVTEAFRFMAQGKHIGKVLLNVRPEDKTENKTKTPLIVRAVGRTMCNPEHAYIITGGLGGFGLELAKWLIKRGAKKIVLTSRTGIRTGYQQRCWNTWLKSGVKVIISTADISTEKGVEQLFKDSKTLGPVGGLFHLAMVLRDSLFENQTVQNFKDSAEAKYFGTKYLDKISRTTCPELKFFVVFSSISCGRGNAGQTNYGWSNSIMERIVEKRRSDGFPGIAIQWGAIGDVGVVLENMGDNSTVVGGTLPQRIPSCMQSLDTFLNLNHPIVSSFLKAEISSTNKTDSDSNVDAVTSVAQILGVSDVTQINPDTQLGDLGLDSLMGVEIKQTLERNFSLVLSAKEIRTLTLNKLRDMSKKN
jgi:fatty acid synthase